MRRFLLAALLLAAIPARAEYTFQPVSSGGGGSGIGTVNGIVKGDGAGNPSQAIAGTDYVIPAALSAYLTTATATATYQPISANLTALLALGTGCVAHTAANAWAARTITGTANEITVTNGNCVSGNPTISLPSAITGTGKTWTGGAFTGVDLTAGANIKLGTNWISGDGDDEGIRVDSSGQVAVGGTPVTGKRLYVQDTTLTGTTVVNNESQLHIGGSASSDTLASLSFGSGNIPSGKIALEHDASGSIFHILGSTNYSTGITAELMTIKSDTGRVGIGTGSTINHTLDVNGNIGIVAAGYLNFGATDGSGGCGFRDNSGTMQFKNCSAGAWASFAASATTDTTNAANITSGTLPDARLSNTIAASSVGSSTQVPVLTYDAHGRLTAATTAAIGGGASQWTSTGSDIYFTGGRTFIGATTGFTGGSLSITGGSQYINVTNPTLQQSHCYGFGGAACETDGFLTWVNYTAGAATTGAAVRGEVLHNKIGATAIGVSGVVKGDAAAPASGPVTEAVGVAGVVEVANAGVHSASAIWALYDATAHGAVGTLMFQGTNRTDAANGDLPNAGLLINFEGSATQSAEIGVQVRAATSYGMLVGATGDALPPLSFAAMNSGGTLVWGVDSLGNSFNRQLAFNGGTAGANALCFNTTDRPTFATVAACTSDARLKTEVGPVSDGALERIALLKPRLFTRNDDPDHKLEGGFYAQEVGAVLAGAEYETPSGWKAYHTNAVVAELTKGMQELNEQLRVTREAAFVTQQAAALLMKNETARIDRCLESFWCRMTGL